MQSPKPKEIKTTRLAFGLSQAKAAALVHYPVDTWKKWEYGINPMHPSIWELFLAKGRQS